MANEVFDDLIKEQANKPVYDKEKWIAEKKAEKQSLFELMDTTATATMKNGFLLQSFFNIHTATNSNVGNTFLIMAQFPNAVELGDYSYWHDKGTSIKCGAKGIKLFETNGEYKDKNGKPKQNYSVKNVFDISQTTAKRQEVENPTSIRDLLRALMNSCPIEYKADTDEQLPDGLGARYIPETQTILIRQNMSGEDLFRSIGAEITHAEIDRREAGYNRVEKSFDAVCVSYILCKRNGIDVTGYSFDSIPHSFETSDVKIFKKRLGDICRTAKGINYKIQKDLDKNLQQNRVSKKEVSNEEVNR